MKHEVSIICPSTPNFLRTTHGDDAIPIQEFTDEQLAELGKEWTEELIKKACHRRGGPTE